MAERIGDAYTSESGRHYALEYRVLSGIADRLANRVPADAITALGALFGIVGSYCLISPENASKKVETFSKGRLRFSRKLTRFLGGAGLGISYVCDLLDGAVAKKSDQGETNHGKILDGIVNKIVDISPALFNIAKAEKSDTASAATWQFYQALAPVSTMIRSEGLAHSIPIAKTGIYARVGRLPFLVASMLFEGKSDFFGKVLTCQILADSFYRYQQIVRSGNKEAVRATNRDLVEYFGATILSGVVLRKPTFSLFVGLVKLAQVKIKEAYK